MARAKKEKVQEQKPFEQMLWQAADKLRKNIDAAEYKHYILGLLFLKYVSDAFDELSCPEIALQQTIQHDRKKG
jgi:type I restriction enzyme M protein